MQTFLPYPDFAESARVMDRLRLGKQRVETLQIMTALLTDRGWVNHPATKMWIGYELALVRYQEAFCDEWVSRGYKDTCKEKTRDLFWTHRQARGEATLPFWFGDEAFHLAHQSNLVRKNAEFYRPIFPDVPNDLEYVWPEEPW